MRGGVKRKAQCTSQAEDGEGGSCNEVYRTGNDIYFHCDVTSASVLMLVKELGGAVEYANNNRRGDERVVRLYIHSSGGDAFAGLSATAHIRRCPLPVVTIADAFVASAASFMLVAGHRRKIVEFSQVLIHQIRSDGLSGKFADIVDETSNLKLLMRSLRKLYRRFTKIPPRRLKHLLAHEAALDAQQCVDNGIVDEVVRM